MIHLIQKGTYTLLETLNHTMMIRIDEKSYAWIHTDSVGEILVTTYTPQNIDHTLAKGTYRLYEVQNESNLSDLIHLELFAGDGIWQGYLLPTGFPTNAKKRSRIIPTKEIITKSTSSVFSLSLM